MLRQSRIERGALTYFISAVGKRGEKIFMDDLDRFYFKNLLQQQKIKSALNIYCYVLLPKQYSLLMETYTNTLSKSMHWINSNYANYFNRRHNRKYKLFKDHYSCFIIEKKYYLEELSCHLHLLPKKDGTAASIFQYEWSSLPGYINRKKTEDWVDYDCILSMFHEKSHVARLTYQKYIQKNLKIQISSPVQRQKRRIILGSREFKKEVLKNQRLNKVAPKRNNDILAKKIIKLTTQSPHWASLKVKKKKFSQATLPRNAAIYLIKKFTDLSNQQISTYFKSLKKSSISQMSQRFNLIQEKYKAIKEISTSLEKEIKKIY